MPFTHFWGTQLQTPITWSNHWASSCLIAKPQSTYVKFLVQKSYLKNWRPIVCPLFSDLVPYFFPLPQTSDIGPPYLGQLDILFKKSHLRLQFYIKRSIPRGEITFHLNNDGVPTKDPKKCYFYTTRADFFETRHGFSPGNLSFKEELQSQVSERFWKMFSGPRYGGVRPLWTKSMDNVDCPNSTT